MDYDADGDLDILSGSYTGELYVFERHDDGGFSQGIPILDENGEIIEVAMSVTPEAIDMDADGDLDLVVGNRMQAVFVIANLGSRSAPRWSAEKSPLKTVAGEEIKGSNAHHADWDGDGVADLLVGSEYGQVLWYRNIGQNDAPRYELGGEILAKAKFNQPEEGTIPTRPDGRVKLHVTDWNGDGRADLLVGDVAWQYTMTTPLTPEEEKEKATLEPGYKESLRLVGESTEQLQHFRKDGQPIPEEFLTRREALIADMSAHGQKMRKFERNKELNTHGWVWLYLRKAETGSGEDAAAPTAEAPNALPALAAPVLIEAGGEPIAVDIGHAAPFVVDFDGDGNKDLVVGQFSDGLARVYLNVGTHERPEFNDFFYLQAAGENAAVPPS